MKSRSSLHLEGTFAFLSWIDSLRKSREAVAYCNEGLCNSAWTVLHSKVAVGKASNWCALFCVADLSRSKSEEQEAKMSESKL